MGANLFWRYSIWFLVLVTCCSFRWRKHFRNSIYTKKNNTFQDRYSNSTCRHATSVWIILLWQHISKSLFVILYTKANHYDQTHKFTLACDKATSGSLFSVTPGYDSRVSCKQHWDATSGFFFWIQSFFNGLQIRNDKANNKALVTFPDQSYSVGWSSSQENSTLMTLIPTWV